MLTLRGYLVVKIVMMSGLLVVKRIPCVLSRRSRRRRVFDRKLIEQMV